MAQRIPIEFDYDEAKKLAAAAVYRFKWVTTRVPWMDTEDLFQEAMLSIVQGMRDGYVGGGLVWKARCRVMDLVRVATGRESNPRYHARHVSIDAPDQDDMTLIDRLFSPGWEGNGDSTLLPSFVRAVNRLRPSHRRVLLEYVKHDTMRECGEALGLTEGRVSQALKAIQGQVRGDMLRPVAPSSNHRLKRTRSQRVPLRVTAIPKAPAVRTPGVVQRQRRRVIYTICADGVVRVNRFALAFVLGADLGSGPCPYKRVRGGNAFAAAWRQGREWAEARNGACA